ncbi:MAG: hypothetical protein HY922_08475 [Elusimicrobia bacterium]|nr:hypothetical protein [Elusimicrobiota bacterium]
MLNLLTALACLLWIPRQSRGATSPQKIAFQGKLLDTSNNPRNGSFDMTFKIFNAPALGSELWSETQNGIQVTNGVFSAELGAVNALTTSLFTSASAYLEVKVGLDSPMTPRQLLLMSPSAFRSLYAEDLAPGDTNYVQVGTALQSGAVFHVASGTVAGPFMATGASSFTAAGSQAFSLNTSSGIRLQAGTLLLESSANADVQGRLRASTVAATTGMLLPQGAAFQDEGAMRWDPASDFLRIGTGVSNKTVTDTDSSQTLTNKTLSSTGGNTVDATHLRTRLLASDAPSEGMTLEWNAAGSMWYPVYSATATVVPTPFHPGTNITVDCLNNSTLIVPLFIPGVLRLNQIRLRVTGTAGTTGNAGLYDSAGQLVANGGAGSINFNVVGAIAVNVVGAPKIIQPGQYYAAITCNGAFQPQVRGTALGAASVGVIKGLGYFAWNGTTLPGSITLSLITDSSNVPFMSFNE